MRENPKIVNNAIAGQGETNISISIKEPVFCHASIYCDPLIQSIFLQCIGILELLLRIPRRILALQDSFIWICQVLVNANIQVDTS